MPSANHQSYRNTGKLTVVGVILFGLLVYGLLNLSARLVKRMPATSPTTSALDQPNDLH